MKSDFVIGFHRSATRRLLRWLVWPLVVSLLVGVGARAIGLTDLMLAREVAAQARCKLVELYPGYPGYRGYITGLDGVGDYECLDDLEAEDADFSRSHEDRENRDAARRLGLSGGMDEWTWWNWMAIEDERGLPLTCYFCAIANADARPEPRGVGADPDDPRLLIGSIGSNEALRRLEIEHGGGRSSGWLVQFLGYDHALIALVTQAFPGKHLNAPEILHYYDEVTDLLQTPGAWIDVKPLYRTLVRQGGFAPTPATAYPEDQLLMVFAGLDGICPFYPDVTCSWLGSSFQQAAQDWQLELSSDPTLSFAEYLHDIGAEGWLG